MTALSVSVANCNLVKTYKKNIMYPDETIIPLFYKFIYKYEKIDVKTLSDKQIKENISSSMLAGFESTLSIIKKTGCCYDIRNNTAINNSFNEYQKGKTADAGFRFEKRTKKATFMNSILFHVRNTLAHAGFNEVGNYYKIIDYDDMRLSAFGFIEKHVFLQLLSAFTE